MTVSVIVPAYQAADDLRVCLAALDASTYAPLEVIIVDDGSIDDTADVVRQARVTSLRVADGPRGPAVARNQGAGAARGDVLVFLDADVAVHPDTLARLVGYLERQPDVSAVFGSYDDQPTHRNIASRYRNLLHHFVHQHAEREATTFWAGCSAVRRDAFLSVGGFDTRYRRPSIEDIELGGRLRSAGHRVWLCADVQVRHMKRWTFASIIRTDVLHRAIPWSRLIVSQRRMPADLNTALSHRVSAVVAWMTVLALLMIVASSTFVWVVLAGLLLLGMLNARLYMFFIRQGGLRFPVAAVALHVLYLLYSSAVFGYVALASLLRRAGACFAQVPGESR